MTFELSDDQQERLDEIIARRDSSLRPSKTRRAPPPVERTSLEPSAREIEVLGLIADGYTNPEIAKKLWLTEETIKSHVRHLLGKLEACNRSQAIAIAFRRGLIS